MSFWKSKPRTQGEEHQKAVSKTSDQWADELARLRTEADRLSVERAAAIAEGGRAQLDHQTTKSADLARKVTEIDAQLALNGAALAAAEDRRQDAERNEERLRLVLQVREYLANVADYLAATPAVLAAEQELSAAIAARRQASDSDQRRTMYTSLQNARLTGVPLLEDALGQANSPEALAAVIERFTWMAQAAVIDVDGAVQVPARDGDVEQIDAASLPPTAKALEAAALSAPNPGLERRQKLEALDQELLRARRTARRAVEERNKDRGEWAERVHDLEVERERIATADVAEGVPA